MSSLHCYKGSCERVWSYQRQGRAGYILNSANSNIFPRRVVWLPPFCLRHIMLLRTIHMHGSSSLCVLCPTFKYQFSKTLPQASCAFTNITNKRLLLHKRTVVLEYKVAEYCFRYGSKKNNIFFCPLGIIGTQHPLFTGWSKSWC